MSIFPGYLFTVFSLQFITRFLIFTISEKKHNVPVSICNLCSEDLAQLSVFSHGRKKPLSLISLDFLFDIFTLHNVIFQKQLSDFRQVLNNLPR